MGIQTSGCAAVDQMARIRITGNVIPPRWYKEIVRENGKPDLLAVTLLSDIVYWYRPVEVRDEQTGYVIGLKKRFKADLLQKTYEQYSEQFGESKRSVKASLDRLESLGLIKKIFRNITTSAGIVPNVMYIDICPDAVERISLNAVEEEGITSDIATALITESAKHGDNELEIGTDVFPISQESHSENNVKPEENTCSLDSVGYPTKECRIPQERSERILQNNVGYPTRECKISYNEKYNMLQNDEGHHTDECKTILQKSVTYPTAFCKYTENTTKTTTENTANNTDRDYGPVLSCQSSESVKNVSSDRTRLDGREAYIELLKKQVYYSDLQRDKKYGHYMDVIDGIMNIIADVAVTTPHSGMEWVNSRQYPHEVVKARLLKIDYDTLTHVVDQMLKTTSEIKNMRSYILTALYNAEDEFGLSVQTQVNRDRMIEREGSVNG